VKRAFAACALLLCAVAAAGPASATLDAHKGVTARHTFNADVYPIFLKRCAHCHVARGVGPMSLVRYEDAFPWAESLRQELLNPGEAKDDFVRDAHGTLTASELDTVLDWAVGGTPEGDPAKKPLPVLLRNGWAGPAPDLVLQPPSLFALPSGTIEITHEFVLPGAVTRARVLRAIDVLPGTPAVVRDVVVSIRTPDGATNVVGRWTPRQIPAAVTVAPDTALPPGAEIIARIHYKKTWQYEGELVTDRTSLGIYFADR
jgi:hypothetical protein